MKITVLNKYDFNKLMVDNNITKDNINLKKDMYIISINDTEGEKSTSYFEGVDSSNVLCLYFDDEVEDSSIIKKIGDTSNFNLKTMDKDQGKEIISFMEKIKNRLTNNTQLFIHCTAGQNRSGSIGKFAADFFEYGQRKFMLENPFVKGNSTVTRILNRLWMWSHYSK